MIECVKENIWYKRKRLKASKKVLLFFIAVILVVSIFIYYKLVVTNKIFNICSDYAKTSCANSVNTAILNSLTDNTQYSDLVIIEKNNNGDIILIRANSYKVNLLIRKTVDKTNKLLTSNLENGVPIPILAFTGIDMLSGYGVKTNFQSIYLSNTNCEFMSTFNSVGINQTLHSIYIKVCTKVDMYMFLSKKTESFESTILISETVLVGKIPEIYLNNKLFD